jgi:hypothetical protein
LTCECRQADSALQMNIHLQLSAPVVAQVWLVTVVMFAKILNAIVVLIVLLDGVALFSMLNQQMVKLLNTMKSILNFLLVLTKTAGDSRLWSNVNLEMTDHLSVFVMRWYHAAPLGRADLIPAQAHQELDIRFDRVRCLFPHKAFVEFDPRAAYDAFHQQ